MGAVCLVAAAHLSFPAALVGQTGSLAEGDRLYAQSQGEESLQAYESAIRGEPENFEALWKAARGALVLGDMQKQDPVGRERLYRTAQEYASRAIAVDSLRIDGHYWLVSAKGREALYATISTGARLAGEVHAGAHDVLARDSLYPGGHYVLGMLNYEVMKMSPVKRWLGRKVLGNPGLYDTSWENARTYLERAVELDPTMILFGYDLGRFYETRGENEAAVAQFRKVVALPAAHPMDGGLLESAEHHLRDLVALGRDSIH